MEFYKDQEIEYWHSPTSMICRGRFLYKTGKRYCIAPYPFVDDYPIKFTTEINEDLGGFIRSIEYVNNESNMI